MTKKTVKDPGTDQVTCEVVEQRDDPLTDYVDPAQLDAPTLAPGTLDDDPAPADLTHIVSGLWPGNPPNRSGNFYFDLNRLDLEAGQIGLLGNLCENFVFERVDVHMIRPSDTDFSLQIMAGDEVMDGFMVHSGSLKTQRSNPDQFGRVQAGTYLGKENVYLQMTDKPPGAGRMVINFVGYLIEPWR